MKSSFIILLCTNLRVDKNYELDAVNGTEIIMGSDPNNGKIENGSQVCVVIATK